jgi:hypothetical protein
MPTPDVYPRARPIVIRRALSCLPPAMRGA